jgi:hypothetical protein
MGVQLEIYGARFGSFLARRSNVRSSEERD